MAASARGGVPDDALEGSVSGRYLRDIPVTIGCGQSRRRDRREMRWMLVHEAGCVECRACHDDKLRRELVQEGLRLGAGIPRSLRRFV